MNEDNYGFIFNNITINNDTLSKTSKNVLGETKINNEIEFYLYILNNNIIFPMPKLLTHGNGSLTIKYIFNAKTLTSKINLYNIKEYINKIKKNLTIIHYIKKEVSFDIVQRELNFEIENSIQILQKIGK